MSKLIRGVFLALILCVGLSAARAGAAAGTAASIARLPDSGGGSRCAHRSDPQQ